jgi:hypothetical protein
VVVVVVVVVVIVVVVVVVVAIAFTAFDPESGTGNVFPTCWTMSGLDRQRAGAAWTHCTALHWTAQNGGPAHHCTALHCGNRTAASSTIPSVGSVTMRWLRTSTKVTRRSRNWVSNEMD